MTSRKSVRSFLLPGLAVMLAFASPRPAAATVFGKNKVQYNYFKWNYLTTKHFDIYYNQGGREVADFAAEVVEDSYQELTRALRYEPINEDPIVLVTYQSHNDFSQTNVSSEKPSEGTGGFTEFLKNRIVLPFEGDHEKFRHVIHHELTHAMMINMLYGKGFGAVVSGLTQSRIPLWFVEGLAEYQSRGGLDPESEMFLRDAVENDMLPSISQLGSLGYLGVYKAGQSVLYWIAYRYGDEKISEILHNLKSLGDFDRALRASIGIDQKELSKRWRRFMKERYFPQVAKMNPPDKNAVRLTNHRKEYCYINNSPALSPNGEWIAFLSDRSDYFDVYLMNTIDGKVERRLVRGQRSGEFEELHWLRPGITWSPDGTHIAFSAKAGARDVLYLIDVESGAIDRKFEFESDALFSPSWSPDGKYIAFIHVLNGRSDLATVDLSSGELRLITSDIYDEADPSWAPDGGSLLFTSNRMNAPSLEPVKDHIVFSKYPIADFDVFEVQLESGRIEKLTDDKYVERTPLWTPIPNTILYVSNQSGIYNLYLHDLETEEIRSLTNIVTGSFQPTVSFTSKAVAFASYYDNGYDIYLLNNPFEERQQIAAVEVPSAERISHGNDTGTLGVKPSDYSTFVFNRILHDKKEMKDGSPEDSTEVVQRSKTNEGKYPSHKYKVSLSPDLVYVAAAYSPYFRAQGSGMLLFTDVLGNHHVYLALDLNQSADNSNLYVNYQYLARRLNWSLGVYHFAYPYYSRDYQFIRDRNYGLFAETSYPFDTFNRIELGFDFTTIDRTVFGRNENRSGGSYSLLLPHAAYVHDTSVWRTSVAPGNGGRWRIDVLWSPEFFSLGDREIDFLTLSADWRRYFAIKKDYSFAFRFSGAASEGGNPQRFFMGGMFNWFNPRYDNDQNGVLVDNIEDIYFSSFVTPLRGVGFYNRSGDRYLLANAEFRFPFIRYLLLGWPLPAYFNDVRGAVFADYGSAWSSETVGNELISTNWVLGYGFGLRLDLGIFPLEWDVAWSPDPSSGLKPVHYLSINLGF